MANGDWKVKQATFQGYVKAKLEAIDKKQDKHDDKFDAIWKRLDKNSKFIERLKVKIGIISAAAGIFFAVAWHFVKSWLR